MSNTPNKLSIRQPNAITNARYDYTKIEKNVIYHAIVALQEQMNTGITDTDLFDKHLCLSIPYNKLKAFDTSDNLSRNLKAAVRSLRKKDYDISSASGWIETGFIVYAEYREGKSLYLEISKALVPALFNVTRNFTAYNAVVALTLQSKYAQRFYEWCCRWRDTGWFEFTPDELNDILKTKMATSALKERVISPSQKELENLFNLTQSDVYFTFEEERSGRGRGGSVKKWRFHVKNRLNHDNAKDATSEEFLYLMDFLKKAWPGNINLINSASTQILTSKCVKKVADRFDKIEIRKIDNLGGYIRNLLVNEYGLTLS